MLLQTLLRDRAMAKFAPELHLRKLASLIPSPVSFLQTPHRDWINDNFFVTPGRLGCS